MFQNFSYAVNCHHPIVLAEEQIKQAAVNENGIQEIEIIGGDYFFKPQHITVKAGIPVVLRVKKEKGMVPHDITMSEKQAGIEINESLSTEFKNIQFTPFQTGKFPFYCSGRFLFFKSHRDKGMEGVLEVVE